ncbi:MAG TPA: PAS domain S-box protein [Acidimicrobiales bacterium]|nr:PAS domain S-box protein [Acidimicrobiales bacterium]
MTAAESLDPGGTPGELVEAVVRLMPDPAVVVDGTGRIVAANALAERQFGYPNGALAGTSIENLVPARFRSRHSRHRAGYTERPTQRPMGAGLSLWAERRDGTIFPVDISLAPLGVPEQPLTLAAIRDLSERRAEWEAEARLASIVASSDDAIISMNLTGTVTSWNPGAERLLGFEAKEMVGRSFWRIVPAQRRVEVEERMARVRASMRVPTQDTKRLHSNGSEVDVAESMSLTPDASGDAGGFAALLRDITERRRVESDLRSLLAESQRRERWLAAMTEVRTALFSGEDRQRWLELITRRVSELIDADGVMVTLPRDADPDALFVAAIRGEGVMLALDDRIPIDTSLAGRVFRSGESVVSDNFHADSPAPAEILERVPIGPVVLAPLTSSEGPAGTLVVTRVPGRPSFGPEDVRLVESFAQQAGLRMELAHAQDERSHYALVADRERIARDLHDHVIQRLFAVGMSLQAAAHSITDARALDRIENSVEELDATIRDVRSTIFSLELQATEHVETSARSRILDVASFAATALGFQPRLQFDGPVDTLVPEDMVPDLLAVVREALSNTARHAQASTVEVHVGVGDGLVVEITDDGQGAEGRTRSSGLTNLRARAENRGGSMTVEPGRKSKGTRIEWRVPLP